MQRKISDHFSEQNEILFDEQENVKREQDYLQERNKQLESQLDEFEFQKRKRGINQSS